MVITGGYDGYSATVAAYDDSGFLYYLPSLLEGRGFHGCGHYIDDDGNMVKIPFLRLWLALPIVWIWYVKHLLWYI